MKKVAWCNWRNYAAAYHSDVGSMAHLTDEEKNLSGKTLCGREFPSDKGYPAVARTCKRCLRVAYKRGHKPGFTKGLDWVLSPSELQ